MVFKALQLAGQQNLNLAQHWAILMFGFAGDCTSQLSNNVGLKDQTIDKTDTEALQLWTVESKALGQLLKVPNKITQYAQAYISCYPYLTNYTRLSAADIARLIGVTKADKSDTEINELFQVHKILELAYQQLEFDRYIQAFKNITIKDVDESLKGSAIGEAIHQARIDSIENLKKLP